MYHQGMVRMTKDTPEMVQKVHDHPGKGNKSSNVTLGKKLVSGKNNERGEGGS